MSGDVWNLGMSNIWDEREVEGLRQGNQQQHGAGTAPPSPTQRLLQWQAEQAAHQRRQAGSSGQSGDATSAANRRNTPQ